MSEPVRPVAFCSPVGRSQVGEGQHDRRVGECLPFGAPDSTSAKAASSASSYSSGASVAAHQT